MHTDSADKKLLAIPCATVRLPVKGVHHVKPRLRPLLVCVPLGGWGEGWARELKMEDFAPQEGSIRVMEEFDLDIFTRMAGKSLEDFRPRLRHLDAGGIRVPYLAPQDLILLKQGSWREKDQLDVAALRKILES
jgi:hypothetical protein